MNSLKKCGTGTEWLTDGIQLVIGAAVFGLLAFFICFLTPACIGGGGNAPVYNDNGVCVENCSPNECPGCGYFDQYGNCITANCVNDKGNTYPQEDEWSGNGNWDVHEPEYVAPPCHVPTDPKVKEMCMPYWAQISKCIAANSYDAGVLILCGSPDDGMDGKDCYCYGEKAYDPETNGAKLCDTVADCQPIACEDWPPEVCQGLPCMLVGKWDCDGGSMDFTDAEFYDNGDGYCRIHASGDFYYKQGDTTIVKTDQTDQKWLHTFNEEGNQILVQENGTDYSFICTKVAEEE